MKRKNLKKYLKKQISSGWREYLSIKIKYSDLGIENNFLTFKKLCDLLGLIPSGEDSGCVDHYYLLDPNKVFNEQMLNIHLNIDWSYLISGKIHPYFPENLLYVLDGDKYYYIEGIYGYKNPKCIYDEENGYPENEPYWLYEGTENESSRFYYINDEKDNSKEIELLQRFINNKNFSSDLFSGNIGFTFVSGNYGQNITSNLLNDLSKLSSLCKTTYEEFFDDYVEITFAIRYKDYVEEFISLLKKIILKYKIKI